MDGSNGSRRAGRALRALRAAPVAHLGFARLDPQRHRRRGLPEAIFCEGKTAAQLIRIAARLARCEGPLLLTRLEPSLFEVIRHAVPRLRYDPLARVAYRPGARRARRGLVAVLTGGTSDVPVAEEAALILEQLGSRVERCFDVGVAGLHRVLTIWPTLRRARAVVVAAGMDGALASVVGGLVRCPVIALPTSIGYGAHFQGLAPLLTMLNTCAPGVGVVNIDNGFGAACLAHLINCPSR